ncbi:Alpha-N-acetylgalactosaminide alpha-2,6-sialyltransferase 3 [Heterocephalus glaber]|uniref:Alpha-N-acetylgalactosaminide alpha-2,6-sialyltransferase 3 n=1 Tax=Heterocephalus glaber TaxID=10181 RepID=G5AXL6_HETGA|nr:Alpha-N-acetylgalactosaminide alpha-2,6-sialyltransferase 3 [Heterocephalus glaber]
MVTRKPRPLDQEQWDDGSEDPTSGPGTVGVSTLVWWSGVLCVFVVWNQVAACLQRGDWVSSARLRTSRKSVIAVSFIAAFLFLLVVRLINEVNFPLLLNCFGQPGTKWIPFSYTYRRPLRTHYGYINVRTQEPLQLDCDLCAIVSNSGQMVGQKVGNEIDRSSCIWRMNNAPTKGYEEDVGRMTMIRVVSHTSVPLLLKNPDYFFKEANTTIYVIWGPFRNMRKDGNGIIYNMLKKTVDVYPNAQIYVTTEKRMSYCDGIFKKETGKDRKITHGKKQNY